MLWGTCYRTLLTFRDGLHSISHIVMQVMRLRRRGSTIHRARLLMSSYIIYKIWLVSTSRWVVHALTCVGSLFSTQPPAILFVSGCAAQLLSSIFILLDDDRWRLWECRQSTRLGPGFGRLGQPPKRGRHVRSG